MFQNKMVNGFHGNTCLAWRSAFRAASQMYRDLHHEETRKHEPLRGLNPGMPVWPLHGGFGWHFTVIRIQLMVFSSHGNSSTWEARNRVPPLDRHTHSHPQFREPKRLSSFENKKYPNPVRCHAPIWLDISSFAIKKRKCAKARPPPKFGPGHFLRLPSLHI